MALRPATILVAIVAFGGCGSAEQGSTGAPGPAPAGTSAPAPAPTDRAPEDGAAPEAPAPPQTLPRVAPSAPALPTRIAVAPDGRVAVTDAARGEVRILDADLTPAEQLEGLDRPLGVAWRGGHLLVGLGGSRCVGEYEVGGALVGTVGAGALNMPNDLALGPDGVLWVADSTADRVVAFDASGVLLRTIEGGEAPLVFPSAVAVDPAAGLVWVGDQGNRRVSAFTPDGAHVRTLGGPAEAFSADWHGRFVTVQGLAVAPAGRLLVLDSNLAVVQVLDAQSGDALEVLGAYGEAPGELRLPLGVTLAKGGSVLVANAGNHRIERLELTMKEVAP